MAKTVLIDLHGVLSDFQSALLRLIGRNMPANCLSTDGDFIRHFGLSSDFIKEHLDYDFWVTIPPSNEFDDVIELVERAAKRPNVFLVTSMCDNVRGCVDGQRLWVDKFLGRGYPGRIHMVHKKQELARAGMLLIDDSNTDCRDFFDAGGHAFLFPRPWNPSADKSGQWKTLLDHAIKEFLAR
jgi:hypothetical protein